MKALKYLQVLILLLAMALFVMGCGGDDDSTDGDTVDGDQEEDSLPDGDTADGDTADGDTADGDTTDGDTADGDTADGDTADGDTADGDTADGDTADGDSQPQESIWCDPVTNICWQDPPSPETMAQTDMVQYCDDLIWAGHQYWRAPCINDLRTLISGCNTTATGGDCPVSINCLDLSCITGDCAGCVGNPCFRSGDLNGECGSLWSMSEVMDDTTQAFTIDFTMAAISNALKTEKMPVRCVKVDMDGDIDVDVDGDMDTPDGDTPDGDIDAFDSDIDFDGDAMEDEIPEIDWEAADSEVPEIDWDAELFELDMEGSYCGCSCTQNPDYSYDCTAVPSGTTFTATGCDWDDGEACTGWHSIVEANGGNPNGQFPDGTSFGKSDWGCDSITIHCP